MFERANGPVGGQADGEKVRVREGAFHKRSL